MKIVNFAYCETMKEENGKNVIVNPFTMLVPYTVPTNFSFYITVGIHDVNPDGGEFLFEFIAPDGEKLISQQIKLPKIDNLQDNQKAGAQLNLAIQNIVLKTAGIYKTCISENVNRLGEFPIEVIPSAKS